MKKRDTVRMKVHKWGLCGNLNGSLYGEHLKRKFVKMFESIDLRSRLIGPRNQFYDIILEFFRL